MRKRISSEGSRKISVNAISGTYVVLLGFDATPAARKGLLGFAIHRNDLTEKEQFWLKGFRTFEATDPNPAPGSLVSTHEHPVQGFQWGDYTAKPDHSYIYKVVPVYGKPKNLIYGTPVEVAIKTESEENEEHAIYFNRGVAGSQAYVRKFGDKTPAEAGPEAFKWLSRGLEESIIEFIGRAKGKGYSIRTAAYEFSYEPVLQAFKKASDSGADVKIVYDCRAKPEPQKTSDATIDKVGIRPLMIRRTANASYIAHNKFIVLLKKGKPVEVLTGSTNFTEGGIFGQSNVVHIIRKPEIAQQYLDYWTQLAADTNAKVLRKWTVQNTPDQVSPIKPGVYPVFSPRSSDSALAGYSSQIDGATKMAGFTAAFGVNKMFAAVMKTNTKNVRYALLEKTGPTFSEFSKVKQNFIALGAVLESDAVGDQKLHRWVSEKLSNLNTFVKYLHTKYLFIDPLGDSPTVISGSANFSDASTVNNDENMLVVKGNTAVADIYLGEFMRLWQHFFFRDIANRYAKLQKPGAPKSKKDAGITPYLQPDDSWTDAHFGKDFRKTSERTLFA